jgi:MoxR-like ATPase
MEVSERTDDSSTENDGIEDESLDDVLFENRVDLSDLNDAVERLHAEVGKILVGQKRLVRLLTAALLADGHVLIEGVPGVAKTLSARLLARTLSVAFGRLQFTPDLMPADVTGTSVFDPQTRAFSFQPGPIFANVVLIDEINRAPAKTQAALFEVMEEGQVTADGETHPLEAPFIVLATQNPLEHEGTYRLPEAQLDRFLFKIDVGYPSKEEETQILAGHHAGRSPDHLEQVEPVLSAEQVLQFRETVRAVHVEEDLMEYVAEIAARTRTHPSLYLGASPRASVALMRGAKALAALDGRDFVTPEDLRATAGPALCHRLILTPEEEMEGRRPDAVIDEIFEEVEVPR